MLEIEDCKQLLYPISYVIHHPYRIAAWQMKRLNDEYYLKWDNV